MPRQTLFRITGIALVYLAVQVLPDHKAFRALTYSLGLAHYLVAVGYARRPIRQAWSAMAPRIMLLLTVAVALLAWRERLSLVLLFAFHHAFNEVYILDRWSKPERPGAVRAGAIRRLRTAGVVFNLIAFLVILRHEPDVTLPDNLLFGGLAVSLVAFALALYAARRAMKPGTLLDNCGLELIALAAVAVSFRTPIPFLSIVAYHFYVWLMYPLPTIARGGLVRVARFFGLTAVLTTGFFLISMAGPFATKAFTPIFLFGSYFHIITAVVISDAHPSWIRRWYGARPTGAPG